MKLNKYIKIFFLLLAMTFSYGYVFSACKYACLEYGSNNVLNGHLKTLLTDMGFYNGKIDNNFDAGLKKAVESLQKKYGAKVDGKVGAETAELVQEYYRVPVEGETEQRKLIERDTYIDVTNKFSDVLNKKLNSPTNDFANSFPENNSNPEAVSNYGMDNKIKSLLEPLVDDSNSPEALRAVSTGELVDRYDDFSGTRDQSFIYNELEARASAGFNPDPVAQAFVDGQNGIDSNRQVYSYDANTDPDPTGNFGEWLRGNAGLQMNNGDTQVGRFASQDLVSKNSPASANPDIGTNQVEGEDGLSVNYTDRGVESSVNKYTVPSGSGMMDPETGEVQYRNISDAFGDVTGLNYLRDKAVAAAKGTYDAVKNFFDPKAVNDRAEQAIRDQAEAARQTLLANSQERELKVQQAGAEAYRNASNGNPKTSEEILKTFGTKEGESEQNAGRINKENKEVVLCNEDGTECEVTKLGTAETIVTPDGKSKTIYIPKGGQVTEAGKFEIAGKGSEQPAALPKGKVLFESKGNLQLAKSPNGVVKTKGGKVVWEVKDKKKKVTPDLQRPADGVKSETIPLP